MTGAPRPFERVYTMSDYYDGPRGGLADFDGRPHHYSSVFDGERDEYADTFDLTPVDAETVRLALEDQAMTMRWWRAYQAGSVVPDHSRVLLGDRARHEELVPVLRARLAALPRPVVRVRAVFRRAATFGDGNPGRDHEVQWIPVP